MRTVIAATAVLMLVSCTQAPDNSICVPVVDPPSPSDAAQSLAFQSDPEWQRQRAEACVHRGAYRLAASSDPAEIVARAVIESFESVVAGAVATRRATVFKELENEAPDQRATVAGHVEERALDGYKEFALMKVVEARAGRCK